MLRRAVRILLWRALALVSLLLGLVGVVLPGLPTVPFLLLAAWASSHGWPALEQWLLRHPRFGKSLRDWRERGSVARRAKWAASITMASSALLMAVIGVPPWALLLACATMTVVALWLWRRPES